MQKDAHPGEEEQSWLLAAHLKQELLTPEELPEGQERVIGYRDSRNFLEAMGFKEIERADANYYRVRPPPGWFCMMRDTAGTIFIVTNKRRRIRQTIDPDGTPWIQAI